jgi:hypothetical protein
LGRGAVSETRRHSRLVLVIGDLHDLSSPEALGRQGVDADVTVQADLGWLATPTWSDSSRSSPAANRTVAECLIDEMLSDSQTRSRICCCAPACSPASTRDWPIVVAGQGALSCVREAMSSLVKTLSKWY